MKKFCERKPSNQRTFTNRQNALLMFESDIDKGKNVNYHKHITGVQMTKIAIVEDKNEALLALENHIARYTREKGVECSYTHFANGLFFLENYKADFDVVFMDIDMPLMNGMEAAKRLREVDGHVPLVFITDLKQYALKGYEVEAMDFLVKPVSYAAFSTMLDRVRRKMQSNVQTLLLTTAQGVFKISVDDILYIEMQRHYVNYHLSNRQISFFGSLSEEEKKLPASNFARCNSGYIVNLARVDKVQDGCVYIGGDCLPISRSKKASFMQSLFAFIEHN